ncbi:hypothetical protein [Novosphingobium sp.]|uniref:hypothetical protein n=1 Tax=Novosphingobium sp. TaxID=1874826 RepID=UPI002FDE85F8
MSKWDAAQLALEIARRDEDGHHQAVWLPCYEAAEKGGTPIPGAIEAEADRLTEARCAAENALIATHAPDLSAAILKIEYARKRWADFAHWPETWWAAIMADLHRLAA